MFGERRFIILTYFELFAIDSNVNAETISCRFIMHRDWEMERYYYWCIVQNNEIFLDTDTIITDAEGLHLPGSSNDDVEGIKFPDVREMKVFPSNLVDVFKNLVAIDVESSQLFKITSDDLKPFPHLIYLAIFKSNIKMIPNDLFIHNPELEILFLYKNQIEHIEPHAFSNLTKLRALALDDNICKIPFRQTSRQDVMAVIKKIENNKCLPPKNSSTVLENVINTKFGHFETQIENLKNDLEEMKQSMKSQSENNENIFKIVNELKENAKLCVSNNEKLQQNIDKILEKINQQ